MISVFARGWALGAFGVEEESGRKEGKAERRGESRRRDGEETTRSMAGP